MKLKLLIPLLTFVVAPMSASLSISPILLEISKEKPMASLKLTNNSDFPKKYQITTYDWDDKGNCNWDLKKAPRKSLIVTPLVFQLQPKSDKLIKIGKLNPDSNIDYYRIEINDITPKNKGDVVFKYKYDLPVLVNQPKGNFNAEIEAVRNMGKIQLKVKNKGNRIIRVVELVATNIKGEEIRTKMPCNRIFVGSEVISEIADREFTKLKFIFRNAKDIEKIIK